MNFKQFVCKNCEKEKEDSFAFSGEKEFKILNNNNNIDINMKSLLSSSDNNISTTNNNLEIIEYPYNDNKDDNQAPNNNISNISKKLFADQEDDIIELQYMEPPYRIPNTYEEPKIYIETDENNNNNNTIEKNEDNNSHNRQISKESSTLINNEDSLLQNKVLLTDYYTNANNKLFNKESNNTNFIINTTVEGDKNICNNFNNLLGVKVECPQPDTIKFYTKSNDDLLDKTEKVIQKKETTEPLNPIKVKTKPIKNKKSSKNTKTEKDKKENKKEDKNLKNSSEFPNVVNVQNNKFKQSNKSINQNEQINQNIFKINPQKIKVRRKFAKKKESSKINKLIFTYRNHENNSTSNNHFKKSEHSIINLSKNRVKYLSHTYLGELLIKNSPHRNTFSNMNEKKKSFNLNASEYLKSKHQNSLNSSKTYVNPFAKVYDRKKKI